MHKYNFFYCSNVVIISIIYHKLIIALYSSLLCLHALDCLNQQISYSSTSPELSIKKNYPYFYRTIPDDTSFSAPRIALLKTFNWSHVGTIFQEEDIHRTVTIKVVYILRKITQTLPSIIIAVMSFKLNLFQ